MPTVIYCDRASKIVNESVPEVEDLIAGAKNEHSFIYVSPVPGQVVTFGASGDQIQRIPRPEPARIALKVGAITSFYEAP